MEHDYKFYLDKGISETNEGKFDEALHSLDKAIALNPDEAMPYFSMAIVFHHLGELEPAYENYTKAIELNHKMIEMSKYFLPLWKNKKEYLHISV